jgi:hypothetical protein
MTTIMLVLSVRLIQTLGLSATTIATYVQPDIDEVHFCMQCVGTTTYVHMKIRAHAHM